MKLGFGIVTRRVARRVAAVNTYEFPSSVRRRVGLKHPTLGAESIALVEAAIRQWFRILARHPTTQLSMPSILVDDMWHEFMLHTRAYAAFCECYSNHSTVCLQHLVSVGRPQRGAAQRNGYLGTAGFGTSITGCGGGGSHSGSGHGGSSHGCSGGGCSGGGGCGGGCGS